jgi:ABC-type phosphate transport system substrate-binding protein
MNTRFNARFITRLLLLAPLGLVMPASATQGLLIVAHPSNPARTLSQADVMRLFTGKTKTLPEGGAAVPVGLKDGSPEKQAFDSQVLNKTSNQVRAYWAQQIFTGRGTPPKEFDSPQALKAHVAAHPDAIGYLSPADVDASVKTLLTLP